MPKSFEISPNTEDVYHIGALDLSGKYTNDKPAKSKADCLEICSHDRNCESVNFNTLLPANERRCIFLKNTIDTNTKPVGHTPGIINL